MKAARMKRTDLYIKIEIEHDEKDTPERLAKEICRQVLKLHGVQAAELSSYVAQGDVSEEI